MAIIKEIVQSNGIPMSYHRVVSVRNITNNSTIIEVGSYYNKAQRELELERLEQANSDNKSVDINVLISGRLISVPYDKDMNVDSAYEYIKTLPEFEDGEDD